MEWIKLLFTAATLDSAPLTFTQRNLLRQIGTICALKFRAAQRQGVAGSGKAGAPEKLGRAGATSASKHMA